MQDSVIATFLLIRFLAAKELSTIRLPISWLLGLVYLFVIHGLIMAYASYKSMGYDVYLVMDVRSTLYLLLVPFLLNDRVFSPKKLFRILLSVVFFSTIFAVIAIGVFSVTGNRVICWSEIFFSDSFFIAIILMPVIANRRMKAFCGACAVLCFAGLLTAQTRSIWISTGVLSAAYGLMAVVRNKYFQFGRALKVLALSVVVVIAIQMILLVTIKLDLRTYVLSRLSNDTSSSSLVNAGSSLGFRIYESYMVWRERSLFGHGAGARIFLYNTTKVPFKFMGYWCIDTGYFELLHKYGFVGLGLYCGIILFTLIRASTLMRSRKRITQTLGAIAFFTLLNNAIISIASGYVFRENVMIYMVVLIGLVEFYKPTSKKQAAQSPAYSSKELVISLD
jgi:hypothetical protein